MTSNIIDNTTIPNTPGKQAAFPLILLIPVVVGAVAGTGAAVGGASTATALGIGIAGGVISGMIVWGASRELDRNMRNGDLARDLSNAMNTTQKQEFASRIQDINKQINRINDLEAKGNTSVGAILRKDLAKSYTKLAELVDNVLPNVRTGSAVKDFSDALKSSRASILNGAKMNVIKDLQLSSLEQSINITANPSDNNYNNLTVEDSQKIPATINSNDSPSDIERNKTNQELAKLMIANGLNPNEHNDIEKFSEKVAQGEYDKNLSNNIQNERSLEHQL
jgi:hypothetical protein